jgi:hypothetical protein
MHPNQHAALYSIIIKSELTHSFCTAYCYAPTSHAHTHQVFEISSGVDNVFNFNRTDPAAADWQGFTFDTMMRSHS